MFPPVMLKRKQLRLERSTARSTKTLRTVSTLHPIGALYQSANSHGSEADCARPILSVCWTMVELWHATFDVATHANDTLLLSCRFSSLVSKIWSRISIAPSRATTFRGGKQIHHSVSRRVLSGNHQ
jgi:hypothetical protein